MHTLALVYSRPQLGTHATAHGHCMLANGRLAMMAIIGMFFHGAMTVCLHVGVPGSCLQSVSGCTSCFAG